MSKGSADKRAIISGAGRFIRLLFCFSEERCVSGRWIDFIFLVICLGHEHFIRALQAVSALSESEGPGIYLCCATCMVVC